LHRARFDFRLAASPCARLPHAWKRRVGAAAAVEKFAQFPRKRVCAARNPKSARHSFSGVPIACGRAPRASFNATRWRRARLELQLDS